MATVAIETATRGGWPTRRFLSTRIPTSRLLLRPLRISHGPLLETKKTENHYLRQYLSSSSMVQQTSSTLDTTHDETTPSSSSSPKPAKKSRRLLDKDPLIVTDRAAARIQELLDNNTDGAIGIRLGVKRRGCNGLSYTLNYATEVPPKDLQVTTKSGINVWIEPMALFHVVGTVMDWEETELTSEFTFNNPNSKGECGCGESFTV